MSSVDHVSRSGKPAVVAHRGASREAAEHTAKAYELRARPGADGLECDVRMTSDHQLVCIHDRTVDRTSDGTGVVSEMSLAQLRELDFGSWHADGKPAQILTLRELLTLTLDWRRPVRLFIETKHPVRYGSLVEQAILETLQEFGVATPPSADHSRAVVISFSSAGVWRIRRNARCCRRSCSVRPPASCAAVPTAVGATGIGPSIGTLRQHPDLVDRAAASGRVTYCWTVDELADVALCAELGVRWLATNTPAQVREWLVSV